MGSKRRRNVHALSPASLKAAAARLRHGSLVAFPTETVYGLGANALDEGAVSKIFAAKRRPADNPLIVHVSGERMLRSVAAAVPEEARRLMRAFWPGPLTLVLPKRKAVSDLVTAGLPTVAIRMPSGVARDLIRAAGVPLAAPSANLSGRPSPTTAAHVAQDFPGLFVLDGGRTEHGIESTVVAFDPPRVLREGAIPRELLRVVLPELAGRPARTKKASAPALSARDRTTADRPTEGPAESPGTKYKHYAPTRPLILFRRIAPLIAHAKAYPEALVLCPEGSASHFQKQKVLSLGSSPSEIARNLFAALRTRRHATELLVLAVSRRGLGRAVMDRLERAATRIVP
jgi:L-threonylcarbamoyladenylate synthase